MKWIWFIALIGSFTASAVDLPLMGTGATNTQMEIVSKIGADQKLGAKIPLELPFVDEGGQPVTLGKYFGTRPVVLALVYYGCPSLCGLVMNGLFRGLQGVQFEPGKEFSVVFVSINPKEKPPLAAQKKANFLKSYLHSRSEAGLHFLTGEEANIQTLAKAVGFKYEYDASTKQYAHPGMAMVLTPDGVISHYHFGVDFPSKDMRLSLVAASGNKIGNPIDHFLLYCYKYDPMTGKYGMAILNALRMLSLATVAALICFVLVLTRRNRGKSLSIGMKTQ